MNKNNLRRELKLKRLELMKHFSRSMCDSVLKNASGLIGTTYKKVAIYSPFGSEINIMDLSKMIGADTSLFFPVVQDGQQMKFVKWTDQDWSKNKYGILEPLSTDAGVLLTDRQTLVITPCLAANRKGDRLGYGGGYYDRFISKNPLATYAACLLSSLILEDLPVAEHDQPMEFLITENELWECC
ncbi:5-formyltetrahydrofolate cyclo-ligase [Oligoflexaceae bacterium]|nr:5-formyltetrahydrofolate cyclo-ligase [Oligoflexaceae bacterium]